MAPEGVRYLPTHEWCRVEGDLLVIGVTERAVTSLGDIIYVDLPDLNDDVLIEVPFGEIEGTRSHKNLNSPADGRVVEVNDRLTGNPDILLDDPYGEGWLIKLKPDSKPALENLLSSLDYNEVARKKGGR